MVGIALKGQCDFVSIMVHPEVSLKGMFTKEMKNILSVSKVERIAAFSRLLIDSSVTAFKILVKQIGTIFMILKVFKEFLLDFMLEAIG